MQQNFNDDHFIGQENTGNDWNFSNDEMQDNGNDIPDWNEWHHNQGTDVANDIGPWDKYQQTNDTVTDDGEWGKWPNEDVANDDTESEKNEENITEILEEVLQKYTSCL